MQVYQRELLVKYLRLNNEFPNTPVMKRLLEDLKATMDEEDVALVEKHLGIGERK